MQIIFYYICLLTGRKKFWMAYSKDDLYKKAQAAITANRLIFVEEVISFLPCDKTTFYRHFSPDSNEYNSLKDLIEKNRVELKASMRTKWYESDNATLQVALMKIISNDDEAARLNGSNQKIDHTTNGQPLPPVSIVFTPRDTKSDPID